MLIFNNRRVVCKTFLILGIQVIMAATMVKISVVEAFARFALYH